MSTLAHSTRIWLALAICALLLTSALPQVARSQEENTGTSTVEEPAASTKSPYRVESIPGGDAVQGDFVVGPGKADVTIDPGASSVTNITVTNRTGETRRFQLSVEDAAGSRDTEQSIVLLGDDRGPYSLKDYVSVPSETFELDHNQRAVIPVTIQVPADAEPGGLYGSVLVETLAQEAVAGDGTSAVPQSAIIARIGTLFFVTVPGDVERNGALADVTTIPERTYFESGPITFGILFENNGPIHLAPYGDVRITNMIGEEVGFVALEPWFALPNSLRLREVTWNRELLFGRYIATVNVNRSYDDIVDTQQVVFWVLPWKIILAIFIALFVLFYLFRSFFRNFEFKRKTN